MYVCMYVCNGMYVSECVRVYVYVCMYVRMYMYVICVTAADPHGFQEEMPALCIRCNSTEAREPTSWQSSNCCTIALVHPWNSLRAVGKEPSTEKTTVNPLIPAHPKLYSLNPISSKP